MNRLTSPAAVALAGLNVLTGLTGLLASSILLAQSDSPSAQRLEFEVASVKLHTSGDPQTMMVVQPGGRFTAMNLPLRFVIRNAYQLQDDQIAGGPSWMATDRFDITAKASSPDATPVQILSMLQTLLAERFKLTTHREMRDLPIFALVLQKKDGTLGPGLRATSCPDPVIDLSRPQPCARISNGRGELTLRGIPFAQFLPFLAPYVNRIVVNQTGLSDRYDIDLKWTPEPMQAAPPAVSDSLPSIFGALQEQLGLKLDSTRGPVEVLVIDRVERPTPD